MITSTKVFVLLAGIFPIAFAGLSRLERRQLPTGTATLFDTKTNECNIPDATSILTSSKNFGAGAVNGAAANGMCGNHADIFLIGPDGKVVGKPVDVTSVGFCTDCAPDDVKISDAAFRALGVDPANGPIKVQVEF